MYRLRLFHSLTMSMPNWSFNNFIPFLVRWTARFLSVFVIHSCSKIVLLLQILTNQKYGSVFHSNQDKVLQIFSFYICLFNIYSKFRNHFLPCSVTIYSPSSKMINFLCSNFSAISTPSLPAR